MSYDDYDDDEMNLEKPKRVCFNVDELNHESDDEDYDIMEEGDSTERESESDISEKREEKCNDEDEKLEKNKSKGSYMLVIFMSTFFFLVL